MPSNNPAQIKYESELRAGFLQELFFKPQD
jgi:hypothetical protein